MKLMKEKNREKIFQLFLYAERLKFSEILKKTKISSNLLAYFLEKMVQERMLEKENKMYKLTQESERLIPFYVSNVERISPLVVLLIAFKQKEKILLIKREKRPYKGFWSLLSGRLLINESIKEAAERIMKEKVFTQAEFVEIKSVIYERLFEHDKTKHGFVFFFVEMNPKGKEIIEKNYLKWFNLNKLSKKNIIASDYWLIKNKLDSKTEVIEEIMQQSNKTTKIKLLNS